MALFESCDSLGPLPEPDLEKGGSDLNSQYANMANNISSDGHLVAIPQKSILMSRQLHGNASWISDRTDLAPANGTDFALALCWL